MFQERSISIRETAEGWVVLDSVCSTTRGGFSFSTNERGWLYKSLDDALEAGLSFLDTGPHICGPMQPEHTAQGVLRYAKATRVRNGFIVEFAAFTQSPKLTKYKGKYVFRTLEEVHESLESFLGAAP